MATTVKKSNTQRVLEFLQKGNGLTQTQAASRFGVANMRAQASYLRTKGYEVYTNHKNNKTFYHLGHDSHSVGASSRRVA